MQREEPTVRLDMHGGTAERGGLVGRMGCRQLVS